MKSLWKSVCFFSAAMLFVAQGAWAQNKPQAGQSSPATEPQSQSPSQAEPAPSQAEPPGSAQPALPPAASSSKTIVGTVESINEGKSMKIRTAEGKTKTYSLKDAAVDASVKVGSAVRVTQSRDVNGRGALIVEPDQAEKH